MSLAGRLDRLEKAAPAGPDEEYEPAVIEGLRRHAYEARTDPAESWETYAAMPPRRVAQAAAAVWPSPLARLVEQIRGEIAVDATFARLVALLPERHRAGVGGWEALVLAGDDAERGHPYGRAGVYLAIAAMRVARGMDPFPSVGRIVWLVEDGLRRPWPPACANPEA